MEKWLGASLYDHLHELDPANLLAIAINEKVVANMNEVCSEEAYSFIPALLFIWEKTEEKDF